MTMLGIVSVLTAHGLKDFEMFGGTAKWRVDPKKAALCQYVVCVKRDGFMQGAFGNPDVAPGTAFLIGKISGVEEVRVGDPLFFMGEKFETPNRYLVKIEEYAEVSLMVDWFKSKNTLTYRPEAELMDKLGVTFEHDLDHLEFKPLRRPSENEIEEYIEGLRMSQSGTHHTVRPNVRSGLTILQAKQGLARQFGIAEEKIDITIRA